MTLETYLRANHATQAQHTIVVEHVITDFSDSLQLKLKNNDKMR